LEIKIKGQTMNKVLSMAVLAAILGATGLQAAITSKEALNIAEKNFPGSSVKDISVDVKKGTTFYEIESFKDNVKKEIKIDANSGQIVKHEIKNKKFIYICKKRRYAQPYNKLHNRQGYIHHKFTYKNKYQ